MDTRNEFEKLESKEYLDIYRKKLASIQRSREIGSVKLAKAIGISVTGLRAFLMGTSEHHSKVLVYKIMNWLDVQPEEKK